MLKKYVSFVLTVTCLFSVLLTDLNWAFLIMESATVTISTKPGEADVYIDGNFAGTSAIKGKRISVGKHIIRVEKEGYIPWEGEIEIVAGENVIDIPPLQIKTEPEPLVTKKQKSWYEKWWIYGLGAVVAGSLAALSGGGGNGGNGGSTPLPSPPSPPGN